MGGLPSRGGKERAPARSAAALAGIHKIQHVVVIMQENRSFDSYFGTYPGADGIPCATGVPPSACPTRRRRCVRPYHDTPTREHRRAARARRRGRATSTAARWTASSGRRVAALKQPACTQPDAPRLLIAGAPHRDVMGYHDAREIPNYWAYARHFVLQDHMFEPDASWSLPAHLFMVSEWSARCRRAAAIR